jgi:FkbM family methyltransferase
MDFKKLLGRLTEINGCLRKTKTPLPLILDLLKLQKASYIAEDCQGNKIKIRPGKGEVFGFYENLIRMDYLKNGVTLDAGDTVVDIGANIGCFTVMAASIVGPSGRVISIEPEPESYKLLCHNIQLNNLSNVTALNLAISDKNELIELHVSPNSQLTSVFAEVDKREVEGEIIMLEGRTLERILDEMKINQVQLIKMDCEGSEYGILESLTPILASRIKQISMEVHEVLGHKPHEITHVLTKLGFQVNQHHPLFAWQS